MEPTNHSRSKSKNVSERVKNKITQAARGRSIAHVLKDEMAGPFTRIVTTYALNAEADMVTAIIEGTLRDFSYLTLEELELAYELANQQETNITYFPQKLTLQFNFKVLKQYSNLSAAVKFAKPMTESGILTGSDRLAILVKFVKVYHLLPANDHENILALEHLIETREIGKPEQWDLLTLKEKVQQASYYLSGYFRNICPDIKLINRESLPFVKPGNLQGIGTLMRNRQI